MSDELTITTELGDDTDLLIVPDEWLENQRITLQQKMSIMAEELYSILTAQRIKRQLQQRNMVAVRCVKRYSNYLHDIVIKVCSINDAINKLDDEKKDKSIPVDISTNNAKQQIDTWYLDGYDIETSKKLKRGKSA